MEACRIAADEATHTRISLLGDTHSRLPALPDLSLDVDAALELRLDQGRLTLFVADEPDWEGICVDFLTGAMAHRQRGHVGAEHVVKAVRGRRRDPLTVIDATAGLGRDSFLLALAGMHVQARERHPVVALLLADGLWRAAQDVTLASVVSRITLAWESAPVALSSLPCDVAYLDPMFPARDKSALVKKEMRAFKRLVGEDLDGAVLFDAACSGQARRIVVKRPAGAPVLAGVPSHVIEGKSNRFDVYAR